MPAHIAVIGAGVIGLSTAIAIRETLGHEVTVLAQYLPEGSDFKNVGYTSPWAVCGRRFSKRAPCLIYELCRALIMYPPPRMDPCNTVRSSTSLHLMPFRLILLLQSLTRPHSKSCGCSLSQGLRQSIASGEYSSQSTIKKRMATTS